MSHRLGTRQPIPWFLLTRRSANAALSVRHEPPEVPLVRHHAYLLRTILTLALAVPLCSGLRSCLPDLCTARSRSLYRYD